MKWPDGMLTPQLITEVVTTVRVVAEVVDRGDGGVRHVLGDGAHSWTR